MRLSIKKQIEEKIANGYLDPKDTLRFSTDYTDLSIDEIMGVVTELEGSIQGYELIANKTLTLSSSSTDIQYPSAKTVYDTITLLSSTLANQITIGLTNVERTTNKTLTLSSSSTDIQYPSAKITFNSIEAAKNAAVSSAKSYTDTAVNGVERISNKVTLAITNTTAQYPNAKSVWDRISDVETSLSGGLQPPNVIDLESDLPDVSDPNTIYKEGDHWYVEQMDVTGTTDPYPPGEAWIIGDLSSPSGLRMVTKISTGTGIWGQIGGNIDNQGDLNTALNLKLNINQPTFSAGQYATLGSDKKITFTNLGINNINGLNTELNLKLNNSGYPSSDNGKAAFINSSGNVEFKTIDVSNINFGDALDLKLNKRQPGIPPGYYLKIGTDVNRTIIFDALPAVNRADWGKIDGQMSNQNDLNTALNSKLNITDATRTENYYLKVGNGGTIVYEQLEQLTISKIDQLQANLNAKWNYTNNVNVINTAFDQAYLGNISPINGDHGYLNFTGSNINLLTSTDGNTVSFRIVNTTNASIENRRFEFDIGGLILTINNTGLYLGTQSTTKQIRNVSDPISLTDAANKNYVDTEMAKQVPYSLRTITTDFATAAISISTNGYQISKNGIIFGYVNGTNPNLIISGNNIISSLPSPAISGTSFGPFTIAKGDIISSLSGVALYYIPERENNSYDITRPDLWPSDTEISFGDSLLFGYKFGDSSSPNQITANNAYSVVRNITATSIVSSGGYYLFPISQLENQNFYSNGSLIKINNSGQLMIWFIHIQTGQQANLTYKNQWVLYKKS